MAKPVVLSTVAHAPIGLHIAAMLELGPSLVSAAAGSLGVGAPSTSVELRAPTQLDFLSWTVEPV